MIQVVGRQSIITEVSVRSQASTLVICEGKNVFILQLSQWCTVQQTSDRNGSLKSGFEQERSLHLAQKLKECWLV